MSKRSHAVLAGSALDIALMVLVFIFIIVTLTPESSAETVSAGARSETLWIFDADFSDLAGYNAGWLTGDRSGTLTAVNYWHKDTLRPCPRPEVDPGTLSWWCGTTNSCWRQGRGYGNNWLCYLERDFPLASWSIDGDAVSLQFDQRYAMERWYDYGYVDVSTDGGDTWTTEASYTNVGPMGAGVPVDWDNVLSHQILDMSAYAGTDIRLRYRFESDSAYSSEDQEDYPSHPVKDGAWQLDNIEWAINYTVYWIDDCESSDDNGWEHTDIPGGGQTGVFFSRALFNIHNGFRISRPPHPDEPDTEMWMCWAVDSASSLMVDGQNSWLVSPPIDIAGVAELTCVWNGWVDFPAESNDGGSVFVATNDVHECIEFEGSGDYPLESGPTWTINVLDWDEYAGNDWLKVAWATTGGVPEPGYEHDVGLLLNRVRIGTPVGTGVPDDEVLATSLIRVYPNPFNPTTTIEYSLASYTRAMLRIVDSSGRVVATLIDGLAGPCDATVTWDGMTDGGLRAASGVYFVVMEADGETSTQKMVLLK